MLDDLTFEQCCALDCSRNMVVTAGPGAGKTRVLTERFCHILLTDNAVGIGEIVAITFTEKAAEEMKARIYVELNRLYRELLRAEGEGNAMVRRLKESLDRFSKNRIGTIHSFCSQLLRQYPVEAGIDPGFIIIQGLTKREMMLSAIQAAISDLAEQAGEALIELVRIFGNRGSLLEGVMQVIEHPVTFKRILETRNNLAGKLNWQAQVFAEYCAFIRDEYVLPYYRGLKEMKGQKGQYEQVMARLDDWYRSKDASPNDFGIPSLFAEWRVLSEERHPGTSRLIVKQGSREISYLDLLDDHFPDLFAAFNPDRLYERSLDIFLELAERSFENYQREKAKVNALDFADLEACTLEFLTGLSLSENPSLITRIQERFRYIMVDEFQDTNQSQWEIVRLLVTRKDEAGHPVLRGDKLFIVGDKRQAIYRFRGADVTVFETVTDEIRRSNVSKRRPFFWQDDRTAARLIKTERGVESRLAEQAAMSVSMPSDEMDRMKKGDIYLGLNFRSYQELIAFFNDTFGPIFSNKGASDLHAYECEYPLITMAESCEDRREKGTVALYLIPHGKGRFTSPEQFGKYEREAALIAEIIQRILGRRGRQAPEYEIYGSIRERVEQGEPAIGILFFAYTHIKTFETIFREAGLPFMVNKGRGFYRGEEVMEMIQLLRYLVDERQRIALLAALRGTLFGLTDPEIFDCFTDEKPFLERFLAASSPYLRHIGGQLARWRRLAAHTTIPELIRMVIRDRGMSAAVSAHPNRVQRMANIEKLIEIAREFEAERNGTLPDFVSYCTRMAEEADEEGEAPVEVPQGVPIHLMTIHSAKGLEFPMVIIPELDRALPRVQKPGKPVRLYAAEEQGKEIWNDREGILPLFGVEYAGTDFRKQFSPLGILLKTRDFLEDVAENRRVFYVGCTRAMHHLILTGHMEVGKDRVGSLRPRDYREGAPILELLDDIWGMRAAFREDAVGRYPEGEGSPRVIWEEPKPLKFTGVRRAEARITQADFRKIDDRIRELDLTVPIKIPSHYQLSPTALALYKQCPLRFYYRYELNIPEDPSFSSEDSVPDETWEGKAEGESIEPRIIGTVVHAYLERHVFGSDLDQGLFDAVFSSVLGQRRETMLLKKAVFEEVRAKALALVNATITDGVLRRYLAGVEQYSELPFVFNGGSYTLRGRIDKLFRHEELDGWAILDWKTGEPRDRDPDSFARDHYFDLQLACYRMVVEELKKTKVRGLYLYFTSMGRLVEIPCGVDPNKEINDLKRFVENYQADPERVSEEIKRKSRRRGECGTCGYALMQIC